jgi:hypothetical protein
MRVAEKSVELNLCAGVRALYGPSIWFGLTQRQEARAGFDLATRLGGRLLLCQVKASDQVLRSGARRFVAEHDQMQRLRDRVRRTRSIFYLFPAVGRTTEICGPDCFSSCSRLLDVAQLPARIPSPTTRAGTRRKNGCHYVDVLSNIATIHSDPFDVPLLTLDDLPALDDGEPLGAPLDDNREGLEEFLQSIAQPGMVGGLLL